MSPQVAVCNGKDSLEKVEEALFCSRPSFPVHFCHLQLQGEEVRPAGNLPTYLTAYLPTYLLTYLPAYLPTYLPTGHAAAGRVYC